MPFFKPAHCNELIDQFWNGIIARCPHDGFALETHFHRLAAGYLLVIACGQCGTKAQVTRFSDPKRFEFRAWSQSELRQLASGLDAGLLALCPICNITLRSQPASTGIFQTFECPRCGNATCSSKPPQISSHQPGLLVSA